MEGMSGERSSDTRESQRTEGIAVTLSQEDLDEVAQRVGVEDGRALRQILAQPNEAADVPTYTRCVDWCLGIKDPDLAAKCIEGCATVSTKPKTNL